MSTDVSLRSKITKPQLRYIWMRYLSLSVISMTLSGCSLAQAPSFFLFGSYFPSWLVGAAISIVAVLPIRWILIRTGIDDALPLRLLFYVCLALIMTIGFSYLFSAQ